MSLREYKKKRDFSKTQEPSESKTKKKTEELIYVIQRHHASHLHYDLRLEEEGVFVSFKYQDKELMIGLGDIIYYSMLSSFALVNFGVYIAILSTFLILIGVVTTFFSATKNEIFPGFPIPTGLGIIPMLISVFTNLICRAC